jgi:hypothetical protein
MPPTPSAKDGGLVIPAHSRHFWSLRYETLTKNCTRLPILEAHSGWPAEMSLSVIGHTELPNA